MVQIPPYTHLGRGILLCVWLKEPFSVQGFMVGVGQVQDLESAHLVTMALPLTPESLPLARLQFPDL